MPHCGKLSFLLCLVVLSIATVSIAKLASDEDEPLVELFKSFLPSSFLEKSVAGGASSKSPRGSDSTEADGDEQMVQGLVNIFNGLNSPDIGNCVYKCTNGADLQPRPGFKPAANGCGSHGFKADTSDLPGITECCNQHDICYGTCNSGQVVCDRSFNACMADACEKMRDSGVIKDDKRLTECLAIGATFHLTAMTLGCEFYRDSQREACVCVSASGDGGGGGGAAAAREKICQYNREKRARESSPASAGVEAEDTEDDVDLSSPVFDLPEAVDREEL